MQSQKSLYEQDLVAWLDDTVVKLKNGQFDDIDIDCLIEEIQGLSGRDKRELESRLEVLLTHLLKRIYVESTNDYRGWEVTIREQRKQIKRMLKQSPSLKNYLQENFSPVWESALLEVREDYPTTTFPEKWQFSDEIEVLLSESFW